VTSACTLCKGEILAIDFIIHIATYVQFSFKIFWYIRYDDGCFVQPKHVAALAIIKLCFNGLSALLLIIVTIFTILYRQVSTKFQRFKIVHLCIVGCRLTKLIPFLIVYQSISFCFIVTKIGIFSCRFGRKPFKIPRRLFLGATAWITGWFPVIIDFNRESILQICMVLDLLCVISSVSIIRGVERYGEHRDKEKTVWLVSVFDDRSCMYNYYHNAVYILVHLLLSGM
jgi:hypothetical protein